MVDEQISEIIELLRKENPHVRVALLNSNPLELLIATILSAQCTDKRVNEVTKTLFKKYRSLQDYMRILRGRYLKVCMAQELCASGTEGSS
ncbi:MAG: hypothetical protein L6282_17915 [Candidatus Methanoperedenaceae archaeon]|nr:hypothetical protein [Candidatus Methanoperedenaceae archaeon]